MKYIQDEETVLHCEYLTIDLQLRLNHYVLETNNNIKILNISIRTQKFRT